MEELMKYINCKTINSHKIIYFLLFLNPNHMKKISKEIKYKTINSHK